MTATQKNSGFRGNQATHRNRNLPSTESAPLNTEIGRLKIAPLNQNNPVKTTVGTSTPEHLNTSVRH